MIILFVIMSNDLLYSFTKWKSGWNQENRCKIFIPIFANVRGTVGPELASVIDIIYNEIYLYNIYIHIYIYIDQPLAFITLHNTEQKTLMNNFTNFENYDKIFNDHGTWNTMILNREHSMNMKYER